jgi:hypothetical protein
MHNLYYTNTKVLPRVRGGSFGSKTYSFSSFGIFFLLSFDDDDDDDDEAYDDDDDDDGFGLLFCLDATGRV